MTPQYEAQPFPCELWFRHRVDLCRSLICRHRYAFQLWSTLQDPWAYYRLLLLVSFDSKLVCRLTAFEAQASGLVSRVVYTDQLMAEARSMAARIASLSALAVAKAKDCINRAYEVPLSEGLRYEQYVPPQRCKALGT